MNKRKTVLSGCIALSVLLSACTNEQDSSISESQNDVTIKSSYTEKDVKEFLEHSGSEARKLLTDYALAGWTGVIYVTPDTQATTKLLWDRAAAQDKAAAQEVRKFDDVEMNSSLKRQVNILKLSAMEAIPLDKHNADKLSGFSGELITAASNTLNCGDNSNCRNTTIINSLMAKSDDYHELLKLWSEASEQYKPMNEIYKSRVNLANEGARDVGYSDVGALWRSYYDMPEQEFETELDKVWGQIQPLYNAMQCHIKSKLSDKYGNDKINLDSPIDAHLMGSVEANNWSNLQSLVMPNQPTLIRNYNISEALVEQHYDANNIVKTAEGLYTSMGFKPLPESFWERSQFTKPVYPDGGYVNANCNAFPLDLGGDDQRFHMCIEPNENDFKKAHSIMEFSYYAMAYNMHQPYYFQNLSGDPASFLAMNDAMELSLTPEYLKKMGLIEKVPDASHDIAFLMQTAFEKIMDIPYYLAVEKWRWQVYSGEISPNDYNEKWWDLREQYQGVSAPTERSINHFDPGASKYVVHDRSLKDRIMAGIMSFQFQKALCDATNSETTGSDIARHRCTVYQSKEAGDRMQAMFNQGKSVPWQQALSTLSGDPEGRVNLDGTAINEYFAPLKQYLDEQNKGLSCAI
jgi:peptidyl-dipeptidase A